jgi:hypothetical protein
LLRFGFGPEAAGVAVLVETTSLEALVAASKAGVVGVRNDVLLRFGFGPEAAGVAALSFRFGGMRERLWRCCPIETNKETKKISIWHGATLEIEPT